MAAVFLDLLEHWPGGAPTGVKLAQLDSWFAVLPAVTGIDERFPGGVVDIAVNAGTDLTPVTSSSFLFEADWWARLRGEDAAAGVYRPGRSGTDGDLGPDTGLPRLRSRPLAEIPPGEVVFACVSVKVDGRALNAARFQPFPIAGTYSTGFGNSVVFRGESLPPLSEGVEHSARELHDRRTIADIIRRSFWTWSRWVPARTGAQVVATGIRAPDGRAVSLTARSSRLQFGAVPPASTTARLMAEMSGVPWFLPDALEDRPLGAIPGDALAPVSSRVDGSGTPSDGLYAIESDSAPGSPWWVMRLR